MVDDVDLSSIHIFKEKAKKLQAEVITTFNHTEMNITFLIAAFYFDNNKKCDRNGEYFLQEILLDRYLSANDKIQILRKILKRKKWDYKICNKLDKMNEIRNLFAHSGIFYDRLQGTLYTRMKLSLDEIDMVEKHKIFFKYWKETIQYFEEIKNKH